MSNLVIMFVKEPLEGKVKTRLAQKSSNRFALEFYKACVQDLLHMLEPFEFVLYSYPNVNFYAQNDVYKQEGDTLGDKMFHAFDEQFEKDYDNIVLIGSDTPHIPKELISESFTALKTNKVVIGPSLDGGYYLIGFNKKALDKSIFEDIAWSTPEVLNQTLHKLNEKELYLLKSLNDIDTIEDLEGFYKEYETFTSLKSIAFLKASGYENI